MTLNNPLRWSLMATGRCAGIGPLDQLLIDHATEYHYLSKVLYTFQSNSTILSCYHVPNIARIPVR